MVSTETEVTGSTSHGRSQPSVVDYNHPLFLNPSEVSGVQIISFQLTCIENYSVWYRSMRVALLGRNKLGMVDGTCAKDKFPNELGNHWERVNAIVLAWIMNFVAKELLGGIMYALIAKSVWDDLYERFHKVDGVRTFNLHKNIASLSQENMSVCKLKLFQFLMGLNDSYVQARSQILLMSPLPSVNQAYAMIVSDESHRARVSSAGVLGVRPTTHLKEFEVALYPRSQGQRPKKNYNVQCDFCKLRGHSRENCWKLNGYPPDFKMKRKQKLEGGAAYNVLTGQFDEQDTQASSKTGDQGR
ncbi:hypothetical protein MTR67_020370 [Solanum verrucosum]|uniref:Retrotransposon Copia-like N-terminal domain-containing protein n=1 Tax=Solanum verrucosum TaxID=315347 RepID=A0AAF0QTS8_SOLVR|nr:hypothetical protein MTR67_020370 [Solanum verrucosum]